MISYEKHPAGVQAGVYLDEPLFNNAILNRVVLWVARHFPIILMVVIGIQVVKGTAVYQGPYARAQYLWNYDAGFIKRGLIGSLAMYLADGSQYRLAGIMNFISYLLYFSFLFFLYRFIISHARTVTQKFVSLLFACCPFILGMGALLGYFDALFLSILLVLFDNNIRSKPSYILYFTLLVVCLLVHELSIIFVVVPLLFQLWIHPSLPAARKYILIGATCALCLLFLLIITHRNESFYQVLSTRLNQYAPALSTKSGEKKFLEYGDYAIKNNFVHDYDKTRLGLLKGYFPAYGCFIVCISILGAFQLLQQKRFVTSFLFVAVCYIQLLIILVAWDIERFICLTSFTAYLCYMAISLWSKRTADQILKPAIYIAVLVISLLSLLTYYPIGDFHAESETLLSKRKQRILLQYPQRLIQHLYINRTTKK